MWIHFSQSVAARALVAIAALSATIETESWAQAPPAESSAPAAQQMEQARAHFKRARAYHDLQEYDRAIEEYRRAYELSKAPKILFNLAQVYRLDGDKQTAVEYYQLYLAEEPNSTISTVAREQVESLQREIAAQEAERARARAAAATWAAERGKAPDRVGTVEGSGEAESVPIAEESSQPVLPGQKNSGAPSTIESRAAPFQQVDMPTRPKSGRRSAFLRVGAYALAGTGVLGLGLAARYGLNARNIAHELDEQVVQWSDEHAMRYVEGEDSERIMYVMVGVGSVVLASGAVLYLLSSLASDRRPPVTPSVSLSGSATHLSLIGRF